MGFYGLVEALRRWPVSWPAHLVALLPKGGMAAPMERRSVVLLPVVYRLWGAVRGRVMQDWLRGAGVLRAGAASAADSLAGLHLARADGDPPGGARA